MQPQCNDDMALLGGEYPRWKSMARAEEHPNWLNGHVPLTKVNLQVEWLAVVWPGEGLAPSGLLDQDVLCIPLQLSIQRWGKVIHWSLPSTFGLSAISIQARGNYVFALFFNICKLYITVILHEDSVVVFHWFLQSWNFCPRLVAK